MVCRTLDKSFNGNSILLWAYRAVSCFAEELPGAKGMIEPLLDQALYKPLYWRLMRIASIWSGAERQNQPS